ncbi:MAG: hypothetical protein LBQ54_10085 [Planctomycetaceae bacterium]|nr:hypothetical protein [Planctomycetaceae bacterium]
MKNLYNMRPKATAVKQHASRGGRMELPLRNNNPLLLVAGACERKNVFTGSRTRSCEASRPLAATRPEKQCSTGFNG